MVANKKSKSMVVKKDAEAISDALGIARERLGPIDFLMEEINKKVESVAEVIDEIWNERSLSNSEKAYYLFKYGELLGKNMILEHFMTVCAGIETTRRSTGGDDAMYR